MQSFLVALLAISCTAVQFSPMRTMYGDDLYKYQGPYTSQFYGQPTGGLTRGQMALLDRTGMEITPLTRFLRTLQPDQVQFNGETNLNTEDLFQQYLWSQMTPQDLLRLRLLFNNNANLNTNTNVNMNLLRLLWTQPRLMSMLLNNNRPMMSRQGLNDLYLNNGIENTMPVYGQDQLLNGMNFQNQLPLMTRNLNRIPLTQGQIMTRNFNGMPTMQNEQMMTRNFNGIPVGENQMMTRNLNGLGIMGQNLNGMTTPNMNRMDLQMLMMLLNKETQVPTAATYTTRFLPISMNKMVKTFLVTKPMLKEMITDKTIQEKTFDPLMNREEITTGDVKIDEKIIPTTPEMVRADETVVDNMKVSIPLESEDMMTLEDNTAKIARDIEMNKKIHLIKKMMNANKRFTKFTQEQKPQIMTIVGSIENNKPEMMTGAEEGAVNKMNVYLPLDTLRSRRQSRLTQINQQFNVDNMPTSFDYTQGTPMLNRQVYLTTLEGQQELINNNDNLRYTTINKKPTMTYITTGENGLFTVPLTPDNAHVGTGFPTGTGNRYTMPTMNNDQIIGA